MTLLTIQAAPKMALTMATTAMISSICSMSFSSRSTAARPAAVPTHWRGVFWFRAGSGWSSQVVAGTARATWYSVGPMIDIEDEARKILAAQPFSNVLGAEVVRVNEEFAEFRIPIREELKQHYGSVHGGAVAAAADIALTFAGACKFKAPVLTSGFTINFLEPARGDVLIARGRVTHHGRSQAVCQCDVFTGEGPDQKRCATALGTVVLMKP